MIHWTRRVTLSGVTIPDHYPTTGAPATPVPPAEAQPYSPLPAPPAPRRRTGLILGIIIAAVVVLGGAAVGIGLAVTGGGTSPQQLAIKACEADVSSKLKAPATAKYSGESASEAGDGFYVEGDVDADNSFGALIRTHWTCGAKKASDGTWTGTATLISNN